MIHRIPPSVKPFSPPKQKTRSTGSLRFPGPALSRRKKIIKKIHKKSGDDGIRTRDLSVANAALSQLSYVPLHIPR